MQFIMRLVIAIVLLSLTGQGNAQSLHPITWTPQSVAPGTRVNIAGTAFVLVRVPVRDLGGSRRYAVSFLATRFEIAGAGLIISSLSTIHTNGPLENSLQIDGFNAEVNVDDLRHYNVNNDPINRTQYNFSVEASASCRVSVLVGRTELTFSASFSRTQQPETAIGTTPDAVPFAEWDAYIHPTSLIRGCDRWIDYIRIEAIN